MEIENLKVPLELSLSWSPLKTLEHLWVSIAVQFENHCN